MKYQEIMKVEGFSEDAKTAMASSPDYFIWWYTAKSLALVVALGALAFVAGRWSVSNK